MNNLRTNRSAFSKFLILICFIVIFIVISFFISSFFRVIEERNPQTEVFIKDSQEEKPDEDSREEPNEYGLFNVLQKDSYWLYTGVEKLKNGGKNIEFRKNSWKRKKYITKNPPQPPMIHGSCLDMFFKYTSEATHYFEYGSGGTTAAVSNIENIEHIWTSDPARSWIDYFLKIPSIHYAIVTDKLDIIMVDYGPMLSFSNPDGDEFQEEWPNWAHSIDFLDEESLSLVDLVFVDGRFRISCLAYSMAMVQNPNCRFMIHDAQRYTPLIEELGCADLIEYRDISGRKEVTERVKGKPEIQGIAIYERKEDWTKEKYMELYERFKFVKE